MPPIRYGLAFVSHMEVGHREPATPCVALPRVTVPTQLLEKDVAMEPAGALLCSHPTPSASPVLGSWQAPHKDGAECGVGRRWARLVWVSHRGSVPAPPLPGYLTLGQVTSELI